MSWFHKKPYAKPSVYIYDSEYRSMIQEVSKFQDMETGGDLFGTFTHGELPVIWLALGPGPNASRKRAEFQQDFVFTTEWQRYLMRDFGIQYIGSWHSHHKLGLSHPSQGDVHAVQSYANRHGRRRTLEIIAVYEGKDIKLNPFFYTDAQRGEYSEAEFKPMPGSSPIRERLGLDHTNIHTLQLPDSQIQSTSSTREQRTPYLDDLDEWSNLPLSLQDEIMSLNTLGISFEEKKKDVYLIVISVNIDLLLAIVLQNSQERIHIIQVNLIARSAGINKDITPELFSRGVVQHHFVGERNILRRIVSAVQRELPLYMT